MILPPLSMWLSFGGSGQQRRRLWLPLFLLWLLLLPIVVLAFAVTIVLDLALALTARPYHRYTLLLLGVIQLVAETRGMVIRVHADDSIVDVSIQ